VYRSIRFLFPIILSGFLAACGGSSAPSPPAAHSTSNPPPAPTTGKVTVLLTDARGQEWDQALATIASIELLGEARNEIIFEGDSTVDLLSLPDFYEVFSVADEIQPGTFDKIRMYVEALELVDLDEDGAVVDSTMAQLVGNGKIDLNPRDDIVIGPGDALYIEIDFDMNKAFKTTTTGNGRVIVRPVVMVNVTAEPPVGRLTRLRGKIGDIDADELEFELCQDQLVSGMDGGDDDEDEDEDDGESDHSACVDITTDEQTGIFGADGMPVDFAALLMGDSVTAIGHLRREYDDDDEDDSGRDIVLHAVTIEVGEEFKRVAGIADGPVTGDVFDLAIDPGQNLGTDDEVLSTQLYPKTRIFHKNGDELDQGTIAIGVGVMADGVLVPVEDMPDTLRAALLILDPDLEITEEVLRGEIVSVNFDAGTLQLLVDDVEQCANALDADIFLISNTDGLVTERIGLGDLEPMQQMADVFGEGQDDAGCFLATDILASALINTLPVAAAGDDQTVTAGDSVMLDGSASSDDDSDPLTYLWTFDSIPEGSTAELASADTAMPSFITDMVGEYVVQLIVNDGLEDSAPDTVTITAEEDSSGGAP
jgi:hypothetical protein